MEPAAILALIGVLIGGSFLRGLEHWWSLRTLEREKEAEAAALAKRVILPTGATYEDYLWVKSALEKAGDTTTPVENVCSCGYMQECLMHCNHEVHPDCTGPRWEPFDPIIKRRIEEERASREVKSGQRPLIFLDSKRNLEPASVSTLARIKGENLRLERKLREQEKALADVKRKLAAPDNVRKRADQRALTMRQMQENLERAILQSYRVPPQILGPEPRYDYVLDAYQYPCCNRKITRQVLQDLNYVHDCPVLKEKENSRWSGRFVAVENCDDCVEVHTFASEKPVAKYHSATCQKTSVPR